MLRLALFAILGATACAAPSKPATMANTQASTRYALQPIRVHGGQGRHSAWQSWTTTSGSLELAGSRTTLTLAQSTDNSPIHCAGDRETFGRQACAPRNATFSTTRSVKTFSGDARWERGALVASLRGDNDRDDNDRGDNDRGDNDRGDNDRGDNDRVITLHCEETYLGYACSYDDKGTLFSPHVPRPSRLDFSAAAPRTFQLQPRDDSAGQKVTGSLAMRPDATALVTLRIANNTFELPASITRTPAGLVISGGPTTSRFTFICTDENKQLSCDTSFDRSVLGQADHLTGPSVFVAPPSSQSTAAPS